VPVGEIGFTVWALFVFATSIGLLIFGLKNKQFDHFEDGKYYILDDKEPAPWPGREAAGGKSGRGEDS
jgi:hypothetical protein